MARYQYVGPAPVPDPESSEIVRPGDIREYDTEPDWGPWECIDPPPEPAAPAVPPAAPFTAPVTPKGM